AGPGAAPPAGLAGRRDAWILREADEAECAGPRGLTHTEGRAEIPSPRWSIEPRLIRGAAALDEEARCARRPTRAPDGSREEPRLVVPARHAPRPVEGDRDHQVEGLAGGERIEDRA